MARPPERPDLPEIPEALGASRSRWRMQLVWLVPLASVAPLRDALNDILAEPATIAEIGPDPARAAAAPKPVMAAAPVFPDVDAAALMRHWAATV